MTGTQISKILGIRPRGQASKNTLLSGTIGRQLQVGTTRVTCIDAAEINSLPGKSGGGRVGRDSVRQIKFTEKPIIVPPPPPHLTRALGESVEFIYRGDDSVSPQWHGSGGGMDGWIDLSLSLTLRVTCISAALYVDVGNYMEKIPVRPVRPPLVCRVSLSLSLYRVLRLRNPPQKANQPITWAAFPSSSAIEISAGQSGIGSTPLPNCVPLLNINPVVRHQEIGARRYYFNRK